MKGERNRMEDTQKRQKLFYFAIGFVVGFLVVGMSSAVPSCEVSSKDNQVQFVNGRN